MEDEIVHRKARWKATTLKQATERFPERRQQFTALSGIPVETLYTPDDLAEHDHDYMHDLGFPGEYPYTRGV